MPVFGKSPKFGKFLKKPSNLMKKLALLGMLCLSAVKIWAQGTLTGDLMASVNFYNRDSTINADSNSLYDNYLSGGEAWLSLRYSYKGFNAFLRADAFHNSNLYSPGNPITGYGIGAWSLSKEVNNLTITGGYIYEQIGSGILFRAYEDRGLLIDNPLVGLHLKYQITDNIFIKGFAGQLKNVKNFGRYEPIIKGVNAEGSFTIKDGVYTSPGIGALNRTLDQVTMNNIVSDINGYDLDRRFKPTYNTYAFTAYNNLIAGDFSWYVEGAYKTREAIISNLFSPNYTLSDGSVVYSTLSYARKGIAVNLTGKRTETFAMRVDPGETFFRGVMNWQPIVARLRPQRLLARYTPASMDLSELALGSDVLISPSENMDITLNYTHINTLEDTELYREAYGEVNYRGLQNWEFQLGVQYLRYNQAFYQLKPNAPIVNAVTPFCEVVYKINDKKSIRAEFEYMETKQDFGSWAFALLEYNIAPKWSFAVSDMYTVQLNKDNFAGMKEPRHFYNFFIAHTKGPHRFTAAYVKQVEGINCTGGVCRYEPAFSGFRMTVTSSF